MSFGNLFLTISSFLGSTGQNINPTEISPGITNWFSEWFNNWWVSLGNGIASAFYNICKWFLAFTDFLQYFVQKLIGIDYWLDTGTQKTLSGAAESDLLFSFLYNDTVQQVFQAMLGVFVVLLIIFTIYAIIKNEWVYITGGDEKSTNSKSKILRQSFKAIIVVLIFPIMLFLGIISSNAILASLINALNINSASTFGSTIFYTSSINGNKYRYYANQDARTATSDDVTFYVNSSGQVIRLGSGTDTTNCEYCTTLSEYISAINSATRYTVDSIFEIVNPKDEEEFYGYCIGMEIDGEIQYYMVKTSGSKDGKNGYMAMYYYLKCILKVDIMSSSDDIGNSSLQKDLKWTKTSLGSEKNYISGFDLSDLKSSSEVIKACYNTWTYGSVYDQTKSFETAESYIQLNPSTSDLFSGLGVSTAKLIYNSNAISQYFDGGQLGNVQLQAEYYVMADAVDFMQKNDISLYIVDATSSLITWDYSDSNGNTNYGPASKWVDTSNSKTIGKDAEGNACSYNAFVVAYSEDCNSTEYGNVLYLANTSASSELEGSVFIMCYKTSDGSYIPVVNNQTYIDESGNQYRFSSDYYSSSYQGVVIAKGTFDTSTTDKYCGEPTYLTASQEVTIDGVATTVSDEDAYYYNIVKTGTISQYASDSTGSLSATVSYVSLSGDYSDYTCEATDADSLIYEITNSYGSGALNSAVASSLQIMTSNGLATYDDMEVSSNGYFLYSLTNSGHRYYFVVYADYSDSTIQIYSLTNSVAAEASSSTFKATYIEYTLYYDNGASDVGTFSPTDIEQVSGTLYQTKDVVSYTIDSDTITGNFCFYLTSSTLCSISSDGSVTFAGGAGSSNSYTQAVLTFNLYNFYTFYSGSTLYEYDYATTTSSSTVNILSSFSCKVSENDVKMTKDVTTLSLYNGKTYVATIYKAKNDTIDGIDDLISKSTSVLYNYETYYNVQVQNYYGNADLASDAYDSMSSSLMIGCCRDNISYATMIDYGWISPISFRFKLSFYVKEIEDETVNVSFNLADGLGFDYFFEDDIELDTFYIPLKIGYWLILIASVLIIKVLGTAIWGVIKRFFEITLYFLAMPAVASTYPLDDGSRFQSAIMKPIISKVLSTYGVLLGINVFFVLLVPVESMSNVFTAEDMATSNSYFLQHLPFNYQILNTYVYIVFMLVAFTMIDQLPGMISSIIGVDGKDDVVASGGATKKAVGETMKTAGDMISGKAAMEGVKSAAGTAVDMIPGGAVVKAAGGKGMDIVFGRKNPDTNKRDGDDGILGRFRKGQKTADAEDEKSGVTGGGGGTGDGGEGGSGDGGDGSDKTSSRDNEDVNAQNQKPADYDTWSDEEKKKWDEAHPATDEGAAETDEEKWDREATQEAKNEFAGFKSDEEINTEAQEKSEKEFFDEIGAKGDGNLTNDQRNEAFNAMVKVFQANGGKLGYDPHNSKNKQKILDQIQNSKNDFAKNAAIAAAEGSIKGNGKDFNSKSGIDENKKKLNAENEKAMNSQEFKDLKNSKIEGKRHEKLVQDTMNGIDFHNEDLYDKISNSDDDAGFDSIKAETAKRYGKIVQTVDGKDAEQIRAQAELKKIAALTGNEDKYKDVTGAEAVKLMKQIREKPDFLKYGAGSGGKIGTFVSQGELSNMLNEAQKDGNDAVNAKNLERLANGAGKRVELYADALREHGIGGNIQKKAKKLYAQNNNGADFEKLSKAEQDQFLYDNFHDDLVKEDRHKVDMEYLTKTRGLTEDQARTAIEKSGNDGRKLEAYLEQNHGDKYVKARGDGSNLNSAIVKNMGDRNFGDVMNDFDPKDEKSKKALDEAKHSIAEEFINNRTADASEGGGSDVGDTAGAGSADNAGVYSDNFKKAAKTDKRLRSALKVTKVNERAQELFMKQNKHGDWNALSEDEKLAFAEQNYHKITKGSSKAIDEQYAADLLQIGNVRDIGALKNLGLKDENGKTYQDFTQIRKAAKENGQSVAGFLKDLTDPNSKDIHGDRRLSGEAYQNLVNSGIADADDNDKKAADARAAGNQELRNAGIKPGGRKISTGIYRAKAGTKSIYQKINGTAKAQQEFDNGVDANGNKINNYELAKQAWIAEDPMNRGDKDWDDHVAKLKVNGTSDKEIKRLAKKQYFKDNRVELGKRLWKRGEAAAEYTAGKDAKGNDIDKEYLAKKAWMNANPGKTDQDFDKLKGAGKIDIDKLAKKQYMKENGGAIVKAWHSVGTARSKAWHVTKNGVVRGAQVGANRVLKAGRTVLKDGIYEHGLKTIGKGFNAIGNGYNYIRREGVIHGTIGYAARSIRNNVRANVVDSTKAKYYSFRLGRVTNRVSKQARREDKRDARVSKSLRQRQILEDSIIPNTSNMTTAQKTEFGINRNLIQKAIPSNPNLLANVFRNTDTLETERMVREMAKMQSGKNNNVDVLKNNPDFVAKVAKACGGATSGSAYEAKFADMAKKATTQDLKGGLSTDIINKYLNSHGNEKENLELLASKNMMLGFSSKERDFRNVKAVEGDDALLAKVLTELNNRLGLVSRQNAANPENLKKAYMSKDNGESVINKYYYNQATNIINKKSLEDENFKRNLYSATTKDAANPDFFKSKMPSNAPGYSPNANLRNSLRQNSGGNAYSSLYHVKRTPPDYSAAYESWNKKIDKEIARIDAKIGKYSAMSAEKRETLRRAYEDQRVKIGKIDAQKVTHEYVRKQTENRINALNSNFGVIKSTKNVTVNKQVQQTVQNRNYTTNYNQNISQTASRHQDDVRNINHNISRFESAAQSNTSVNFGSNFEQLLRSYLPESKIKQFIKEAGLKSDAQFKGMTEAEQKQEIDKRIQALRHELNDMLDTATKRVENDAKGQAQSMLNNLEMQIESVRNYASRIKNDSAILSNKQENAARKIESIEQKLREYKSKLDELQDRNGD